MSGALQDLVCIVALLLILGTLLVFLASACSLALSWWRARRGSAPLSESPHEHWVPYRRP